MTHLAFVFGVQQVSVCWTSLSILLFTIGNASCVYAQFRLDIVQVSKSPDEYRDETSGIKDELELVRRNRVVGGLRIAGNVENMLFGKYHSAANARRQLTDELLTWVDLISLDADLTREQRKKLLLAGQRDIAVYFREADEIKESFEDPNNAREALERLKALSTKLRAGLFGESSMLERVTKRTLSSDLNKQQRSNAGQRKVFAFRAAVKLIIADLEQVTQLNHEQRMKLLASMQEVVPLRVVERDKYYTYAAGKLIEKESTQEILGQEKFDILQRLYQDVLRGRVLQNVIMQNGRLQIEAF